MTDSEVKLLREQWRSGDQLSDHEKVRVQQARDALKYPHYVPFAPSLLAIIDRLTGNSHGKD